MFDNIGKKIKSVAKIFCWIGILCNIGVAIYCFIRYNSLTSLATYQFMQMKEARPLLVGGFICLIAGPLLSWLCSLVLYGFGELIDDVAAIYNQSLRINRDKVETLYREDYYEEMSEQRESTKDALNITKKSLL